MQEGAEAENSRTENQAGQAADAERLREIAAHSLMVGDRHYDIEGAMQAGVDSLGVLYGYGDERELCHAGAAWLAGSPAEAVDLIGKM